ncbi:TetR/AcrR family transcriptional regulator [Tabrizicola sp.]|uniref:TetR/AcrR family transcriptional regulator n=1 Tax=Tabrizicola sp. TaxID=2005166 RepID=UPI003F2A538E
MARKTEGPSREDWVVAGMSALMSGGIEAVKVEKLATALGISKGPFYWRFANRDELLQAIVDFWRRDLTQSLIDATRLPETPEERLRALAEVSLMPHAGLLDVATAECALRAWAATDTLPRETVREVDASRISHVTEEFVLVGAPREVAEQLAKAVYVALLGLYTVRQYTPELADDRAFMTTVDIAIREAQRQKSAMAAGDLRVDPPAERPATP